MFIIEIYLYKKWTAIKRTHTFATQSPSIFAYLFCSSPNYLSLYKLYECHFWIVIVCLRMKKDVLVTANTSKQSIYEPNMIDLIGSILYIWWRKSRFLLVMLLNFERRNRKCFRSVWNRYTFCGYKGRIANNNVQINNFIMWKWNYNV